MQILNNIFDAEQVQVFRDYWNNNHATQSYVNWEIDGKALDRWISFVPGTKEYDMLNAVLHQFCKNPLNVHFNYQRQAFAHNIHIDEPLSDLPYYTMVLSLDTVPEFKTIVWKETAKNNKKLQEHVEAWGMNRSQKVSNISEVEDLEHTFDENQQDYFADYLHLDGIYTYQAGSGVLFNARQYHCTSNWLKYPQFTHRNLLQIHFASETPIE